MATGDATLTKTGGSGLSLGSLPTIYLLPTHMTTDDLHDLEDHISDLGGDLTYDISEARIVLGKVASKKRAVLELRMRQLNTEETVIAAPSNPREESHKRRKLVDRDAVAQVTKLRSDSGIGAAQIEEDSTTEDEDSTQVTVERKKTPTPGAVFQNTDMVSVVNLDWLEECIRKAAILDPIPWLIYQGRRVEKSRVKAPLRHSALADTQLSREGPMSQSTLAEKPNGASIIERARADARHIEDHSQDPHHMAAPHGQRKMGARPGFHRAEPPKHAIKLMEMTTEDFDSGNDLDMPPAPDWVEHDIKYSCQRSTPAPALNEDFIDQLKKIRLARILTADEIGVRAYSTSIAALAAYQHRIVNPKEILRLPGCDVKTANLWIEWKNNDGKIEAAEEAEKDPTLKNLNLFYEIWGVGATTAREFYFHKGWIDLDDVVEYGWSTLSRVQQIGVKYYDEFKDLIPRKEVEFIAEKVREHAIKVRDPGIELMVVGGYRRGKEKSGDVDMVVSHRHIEKTAGLVQDIVESLEKEGWITHTLTLQLTSTHRGQSVLPFKSAGVASHGSGFDTLDKALVVWQDPVWPNKEADLAAEPKAKNPNIHRRVDIIVAPWRTVGCAVTGWSGGTTFQRDLRRFAKNVKGWKFDSSGVRDRKTGDVVDLEGPDGVSGSMVDAEKAVFKGMGLVYREPWERCTG